MFTDGTEFIVAGYGQSVNTPVGGNRPLKYTILNRLCVVEKDVAFRSTFIVGNVLSWVGEFKVVGVRDILTVVIVLFIRNASNFEEHYTSENTDNE